VNEFVSAKDYLFDYRIMKESSDIAVIHLVRAANPTAALQRFLDSYIECPAGMAHKLVFLLKGFGTELPADVLEQLDRVHHSKIHCVDRGYDIASYFYVAERISESLVVFINSFSVLLGAQWLLKLQRGYTKESVGLVGATGSWESISFESTGVGLWKSVKLVAVSLTLRLLFPAFPNPHIRTNCFLLARSDFLAMHPILMRSKLDAWLFESGRNSMTRQMLRRGRKVLIVGRDGCQYQPKEWAESRTFWQSQQENLLIHDNRTMAYQNGSPEFKAKRNRSAWNVRNF
jgi:hypothetical protein